MASNQGSEMINQVFDDVCPSHIESAARVLWREVHAHPGEASCFCPAVEVLCALYEMGYRMTKEGSS